MVNKWPCGQFPQQTLMTFEMLAACLISPKSNIFIEIHRSPCDRDRRAYLNLEEGQAKAPCGNWAKESDSPHSALVCGSGSDTMVNG